MKYLSSSSTNEKPSYIDIEMDTNIPDLDRWCAIYDLFSAHGIDVFIGLIERRPYEQRFGGCYYKTYEKKVAVCYYDQRKRNERGKYRVYLRKEENLIAARLVLL